MTSPDTGYYPPRARWYSPIFLLGDAFRRRLNFDRINLPQGVSARHFLGGFLVPGLAVYFRGPHIWGIIAMSVSGLLALAFLALLGLPAGNYTFAALLSLHSSGLGYLCSRWVRHETFGRRMALPLLLLISLSLLLYTPVRGLLEKYLFAPIQIEGQVLVINPGGNLARARRGDFVVYRMEPYEVDMVRFHGGLAAGPILARPGDHVTFGPDSIEVNGIPHPRERLMPRSGELIVPENHWFLWPKLVTLGHGVSDDEIGRAFMELGTFSQAQVVGKPFHQWFWRRQNL